LLSPHVHVDNRFADRPPSERDFDYVDLLHVDYIADDTVDDALDHVSSRVLDPLDDVACDASI